MKLAVEHLNFAYEKKETVLRDLCFSAEGEQAIGIIGANGAGKSTLLKILVGLNSGFEGRVLVDELELEQKNLAEIRRRIGYVFQDSDSQLFMTTVEEDVAFAPRNYGFPEAEVQRRVQGALAEVGISALAKKPVYKLSGGEKKLASIATVLSMEPEFLLMDEPSAALDPKNRRNLIGVLNRLKCLKVIASHDLDFIWDTCGRVLVIGDGTVAADGIPGEILTDESLLTEYGLELPLSIYHAKRN
ncbi:MAG: energy-coupling factor ABC transporter ATP-binding protein [Roseburia sp.]